MKSALSVAVVALLAACAAPSRPIQTDVAPYIAVARQPASAEMEALARGRLAIVDGCVRIMMGADRDPGSLVVWPAGTTVDASTGAGRILNGRSSGAASIGDRIEMGGGQVQALQADALVEPVPARCHGPYWIAGSSWAPSGS